MIQILKNPKTESYVRAKETALSHTLALIGYLLTQGSFIILIF